MRFRVVIASDNADESAWMSAAAAAVHAVTGVITISSPDAVRGALSGNDADCVVLGFGMAQLCHKSFPLTSSVPVALLVGAQDLHRAQSLLPRAGLKPVALPYKDTETGGLVLSAWLSGVMGQAKIGPVSPSRLQAHYEKRYENLIHALPDIVYELDPEGRFTLVNDAISVLGYSPEELVGKHFSVLFYDDDADAVDRDKVLADFSGMRTGDARAPKFFNERRGRERRTANLEVRLRCKARSGSQRSDILAEITSYGELSSAGEYGDGNGTFTGSVGIIRDVTLKRKSEEMLRKLFQAVDQLSSCVFITNHAFHIEYVNPAFFLLTGFSPGDVLGTSLFRFLAFMPETAADLQKHVQEGFEVRDEVLVPTARGGQFWAELSVCPVRSPLGMVTHAIAIASDVSSKKAMEELVRSAKHEARNASHAQTAFLASMTHELKNPISAIMAACELLSDDPEQTLRRAGIIRQQAQGLHDIIAVILDYVRSEGGNGPSQHLAFPLGPFIAELCARFKPKAEAKSLSVSCVCDEDATVEGDPDRLGRALALLLDNAVKYTEHGSVSLNASMDRQDGNVPHLVITVRDTGPGIRADDQARVFQPFARVGPRRGVDSRGVGIGLALARNLVKTMGGEIRLASSPGEGSTFTLIVPAASPPLKAGQNSASPYTILLVDDNEINVEYLRTLLENAGFRILAATGAAEAFRILESRYVDAAVLDIQMPGYSGIELAKAIKVYAGSSYSPSMPLFAMTAHEVDELVEDAQLFKAVFTKPADIRRLASAINTAMRERETVSALYFNTSNPVERRGQELESLRAASSEAIAKIGLALDDTGVSVDVRSEAIKLSTAFQRFACAVGIDYVRQLMEYWAKEDHAILKGVLRRIDAMLAGAYRSSSPDGS